LTTSVYPKKVQAMCIITTSQTIRRLTHRAAGILICLLLVVPNRIAAQETFHACYVPNVGAIYFIKVAGLPSDCLSTSHVGVSWSEGGIIADGSVTSAKLATAAVTSLKIATGAVTGEHIQQMGASLNEVLSWNGVAWEPRAVTGGEVSDGSITTAKLANNAVTSLKITAGAVGATQLATASVTSSKIATGAINGHHLQQMGANVDEVLTWNGNLWEPQGTGAALESDPTWTGNTNTTGVVGRTGSVGIGITSPSYRLHVQSEEAGPGNADPVVAAFHTSTSTLGVGVLGHTVSRGFGVQAINANDGGSGTPTALWSNVLRSDGYSVYALGGRNYFEGSVGVGTTSPVEKLHVVGGTAEVQAGRDGDAQIRVRSFNGGENAVLAIRDDGTARIGGSSFLDLRSNSGVDVRDGGSQDYRDIRAASFVAASSRDYKERITYLDSLSSAQWLQHVLEMRPATYRLKGDGAMAERLGFIAEELPGELRSNEGKGVDLYALTTAIAIGLQGLYSQTEQESMDHEDRRMQLRAEIEELNRRLAALERILMDLGIQ